MFRLNFTSYYLLFNVNFKKTPKNLYKSFNNNKTNKCKWNYALFKSFKLIVVFNELIFAISKNKLLIHNKLINLLVLFYFIFGALLNFDNLVFLNKLMKGNIKKNTMCLYIGICFNN